MTKHLPRLANGLRRVALRDSGVTRFFTPYAIHDSARPHCFVGCAPHCTLHLLPPEGSIHEMDSEDTMIDEMPTWPSVKGKGKAKAAEGLDATADAENLPW